VTQEFHLSITPLGQDRYLVRTEEVAPGVPLAEEQVVWPVDTWLQQTAVHGHDPLTSLLRADSSGQASRAIAPSPVTSTSLNAFGQTLYNALFTGRIRDSWLAAQGVAQNRREVLRLRLGLKDSRLQRLPWEVIYGDDRPLATGTDIVFTRYYAAAGLVDLAAMPALPTGKQPLQVLMVLSEPNDQERLALRKEVLQIQTELQSIVWAGSETGGTPPSLDIQLTLLEQPGRADLVQALERGQYQVLHYAGHSDVSETGGDLYLVNPQTGLSERLSGEDLAGLLVNNGIRLAIFNSCRGAYTAANDDDAGWREQNLVQALVNRGVPGVIAMAERIPDNVAITFTQLFYCNLKQGVAIDLSLSRTRQGLISTYGSDQSYWMLPLLYLHPEFDGYLVARDRDADDWADLVEADSLDGWPLGAHHRPRTTLPSIEDLLAEDTASEADDLAFDRLLSPTEAEPSYEQDAAVVTDLLQQLSLPQPSATAAPLSASPEETLLPEAQPGLPVRLPERPQAADAELAAVPEPNGVTLPGPRWRPPNSLFAWLSVGLLGTLITVIVAAFVIEGRNIPSPVASPDLQLPNSADADAAGSNNALSQRALEELTVNDVSAARGLMEKLLNQQDLDQVMWLLERATPKQQETADLLYIRGRLNWERMAQGSTDAGPDDSRRDWEEALKQQPDFLDVWIALGFAYHVLERPSDAIAAWEKAIVLDQRQVRDGEPGRPAIASPQTLNAYAGLAMLYNNLGEIAATPEEQVQLQAQARQKYEFVAAVQPSMLSMQQLSREWLWQPSLLNSWNSTIETLAAIPAEAAQP
jgi:tetratricopeptide (TPR) repeat protein